MPTQPDNGILARVGGRHVAEGSQSLPDPAIATDDTMTAVVDTEWAGRVRITYLRQRFKHHKSKHWAWCAKRADPVE